jgi:hypothetical protein
MMIYGSDSFARELVEHWQLCNPPPGTPTWITPELVLHTIRVWQPYYADVVTPDEAITMVLNVGRMFSVLRESSEAICSPSQS